MIQNSIKETNKSWYTTVSSFKSYTAIVFLFLCFLSVSAQEVNKPIEVIPDPPYEYAREEMDSIFRVAEKHYYLGSYEQIIEKVPALFDYAHQVGASRAETRLRTIFGLSFVKLEDTDSAELIFQAALKDALKRKDTFDILSHYINLGNTHFNSDSDKAIEYFRSSIDYVGNIDVSDLA
jgi:tetratricopeptide (TPR) repeat protein